MWRQHAGSFWNPQAGRMEATGREQKARPIFITLCIMQLYTFLMYKAAFSAAREPALRAVFRFNTLKR